MQQGAVRVELELACMELATELATELHGNGADNGTATGNQRNWHNGTGNRVGQRATGEDGVRGGEVEDGEANQPRPKKIKNRKNHKTS